MKSIKSDGCAVSKSKGPDAWDELAKEGIEANDLPPLACPKCGASKWAAFDIDEGVLLLRCGNEPCANKVKLDWEE